MNKNLALHETQRQNHKKQHEKYVYRRHGRSLVPVRIRYHITP
jgi:hypothetical protein